MKKLLVFFVILICLSATSFTQSTRLWKGLKGLWTIIETVGTVQDIYGWLTDEPENAGLTFSSESRTPINVYVNGGYVGQVSSYQSLACSVSPGVTKVSAVASDGTRWDYQYELGPAAREDIQLVGNRYDQSFEYVGSYGRFPEASKKLFYLYELEKMSSWDLRIMRNEIFARRGYIFHVSREMQDYFNSQYWYQNVPKITEDGEFLMNYVFSEIEKQNIALIQQVEKSR